MRTQALLAQRWRESGYFPFCTDAGAGRPGKDVLNTPGLSVEIKAKNRLTLPEAMRQAEANGDDGDVAIVVWRHERQGETQPGQWTVTMRLDQFEKFWELRGNNNG